MKANIFTSTKHWKYTSLDELAEQRLEEIVKIVNASLPADFYSSPLLFINYIKSSPLFPLL
jgi:hypothetical protein